MLLKIILIFTFLPLLEFYILIKVGIIIGAGRVIFIVLFTGILGAFLARDQGLKTIQQIRSDLRYGVFPAEPLWDGGFILIGSIFLITPGLLTDFFGFLCIIPFTRHYLKRLSKIYVKKKLEDNGFIDIHF